MATTLLLIAILAGEAILLVVLLMRRDADVAPRLDAVSRDLRADIDRLGQLQREEARNAFAERFDALRSSLDQEFKAKAAQDEVQRHTMQGAVEQLHATRQENHRSIAAMTEQMTRQLTAMREENDRKLEAMRVTVDEKLQGTLEKRLGEAFSAVSERLEAVHKGLGEMQGLAVGVGDLKKVLANVKTRGVWGEFHLASILEQFLVADQYVANYAPSDRSREAVEFAVKFPGRDGSGAPVYMPIDAKFPQEDFVRLVEASERGDAEGVREARASLLRAIRKCARDIATKYINPPVTTDHAVMFLPTESLYAEVVREPGLLEELQRQHKVNVAGPTTLAALLTAFRVGFHSLVIEQRAGEVRGVLGTVKAEFRRFGELMDKVRKQLNTVTSTIESTKTRTRAMERALRDVESGDAADSAGLLALHEESTDLEVADAGDNGEDDVGLPAPPPGPP